MFGQDRNQLRQMYLDAWRKQQNNAFMQPLETMIAEVVSLHPEYHALLEQGEDALDKDFLPEVGEANPFMHMGMHMAIREQLSIDRPPGIVLAHKKCLLRFKNTHEAEHQIMECLGQSLWNAQRNNSAPDEAQYLSCIQKLANYK